MTRSNKLSVCIATYNEEYNIGRCIESVYDWVDEIVVVDGTSTDKTETIAKSYGNKVKVFVEKNVAMFHINKQKALDKATGTWILQLDADEEITNDLREEIMHVLKSKVSMSERQETRDLQTFRPSDNIIAYQIPRLNFFLGKPLRKGGQYPDYTIRLYKNGAAKFPCKSVHEQVEIVLGISNTRFAEASARRVEYRILKRGAKTLSDTKLAEQAAVEAKGPRQSQIGFLHNPINHYPYKTFSDYIAKWDRYCDLEAQLLYERNIKLSAMLFLQYFLFKPKIWFVISYFRHKGFMDGFPGYIFALFSSMRFFLIYIKLYEKTHR